MIKEIMTPEQILLLNSKIENVLDGLNADEIVRAVHCFADYVGKMQNLSVENVQVLLLSNALSLEVENSGSTSIKLYLELLRNEAKNNV